MVTEDAMRGRKTQHQVILPAKDRAELESWQRSTTAPAGLARRGRMVLLAAAGQSLTAAAATCGLSLRNGRKWVLRYLREGLAGLADQRGRGHKPVFSPRGRVASGQDGLRATG